MSCCLYQLQGSSAVTPVFVQTGQDVFLDVNEADVPEGFVVFFWTFNGKNNLVSVSPNSKPNILDDYTGRIEPSEKKYSVTLKNLQNTDSGVYTAQVFGSVVKTLAEYKVTVQDPVSPVGLTVDSVSNSSDSCNLTVTCSSVDSHISSTFTCDDTTCSQEGGERSEVTKSGASLQVYYLSNASIICNHSNQVSWTKNMTNIHVFCLQQPEPPPSTSHHYIVGLVVGFLAVLLLLCAVGVVVHRRKRGKYEGKNNETMHAEVETHQPQDQRPLNKSSCSSQTDTIYSLAGSPPAPTQSTETSDRTQPESLYAHVEKVNR
ncbi:uncharacterized protein LOC114449279 isoform X2 [Parambassis ranga]|uniref:Uncharacterized protein LOC114449279 isoform X2 n=1 Tax=Parambassis ranga TaxID=210632 RepID=A0A6P7K4K5_9TELE|nr:uncharacterized protein LOC114449279 isoform X2 [Parambassis ranga]